MANGPRETCSTRLVPRRSSRWRALAEARVLESLGLDQGAHGALHIERAEREEAPAPRRHDRRGLEWQHGNAHEHGRGRKGYRMIVVMPVGMSPERAAISTAFGAQLVNVGNFHVNEALALADNSDSAPALRPHQFESEWNIEENRTGSDRDPRPIARRSHPDAFVMGVGTGGTLIGVGQAFRARNPDVLIVGLEPSESCTIQCGDTGLHKIEGIADGFVPANLPTQPRPRQSRGRGAQ